MKALQKLHNDVLVGKVRKSTFLTESKKAFPNLFSNLQPYVQKGIYQRNFDKRLCFTT